MDQVVEAGSTRSANEEVGITPQLEPRSKPLIQQARELFAEGKVAEAKVLCREVYLRHTRSVEAWLLHSECLLREGEFQQAFDSATTACHLTAGRDSEKGIETRARVLLARSSYRMYQTTPPAMAKQGTVQSGQEPAAKPCTLKTMLLLGALCQARMATRRDPSCAAAYHILSICLRARMHLHEADVTLAKAEELGLKLEI